MRRTQPILTDLSLEEPRGLWLLRGAPTDSQQEMGTPFPQPRELNSANEKPGSRLSSSAS